MDQTKNAFNTQSSINIWAILAAVVITAVVAGGVTYYFQKTAFEMEKQSLQQQIDQLQTQISRLEQRDVEKQEPVAEKQMKIKIYYINKNVPSHNGSVGCGDEAVGIDRQIASTNTPLKAAMEELLSSGQSYLEGAGLYNALANQNWKLESVSIINGEAIIKFSGKYVGGGTCEDPRLKAQVEKTALQFPTVKKVSIFVGGVSLDKLISGKGE